MPDSSGSDGGILIEDVTDAATNGNEGLKSFASQLQQLDGNEAHPEDAKTGDFTFHYLEKSNFRVNTDRGLHMLFMKWGFGEGMCLGRFRFEQPVETKDDAKRMLQSLLRSGHLARFGVSTVKYKEDFQGQVEMDPISTEETSMDLFNRLDECGAVSEKTGHIRGRLDEYLDNGIIVNSILREVLFMEESELFDVYTKDERMEFLFRIFKHVVIGGATNQYEDMIDDYLKTVKVLYRDFLNVRKREDGEVEVVSWVFEAGHKRTENGPSSAGHLSGVLNDHPMSFSYFIVDKLQRYVTFWGFGYKSAWN